MLFTLFSYILDLDLHVKNVMASLKYKQTNYSKSCALFLDIPYPNKNKNNKKWHLISTWGDCTLIFPWFVTLSIPTIIRYLTRGTPHLTIIPHITSLINKSLMIPLPDCFTTEITIRLRPSHQARGKQTNVSSLGFAVDIKYKATTRRLVMMCRW